jgi:hypothetical protein
MTVKPIQVDAGRDRMLPLAFGAPRNGIGTMGEHTIK